MKRALKKQDLFPLDDILLVQYYDGVNEPVGIWVQNRYKEVLTITAYKYLKNESFAPDVLQDVAEKLCKYAKKERAKKFKPGIKGVPVALRVRVRGRALDINRNRGVDVNNTLEIKEVGEEVVLSQRIIDILNDEMERDLLREYFIANRLAKDWAFLQVWLKYGLSYSSNKPIANDLQISLNEVKATKLRIKRKGVKFYFLRQKASV